MVVEVGVLAVQLDEFFQGVVGVDDTVVAFRGCLVHEMRII